MTTIYHGTNHSIIEPNPAYDYNRIANGLGFYWTTNKDEALSYGKNLFERELSGYKLIDRSVFKDRVSRATIHNWIKQAQKVNPERIETAASNFAEDLEQGIALLIEAIYNESNKQDQWLAFQGELMLRDTKAWCDIAQAIGIDGIVIEQEHATHYVLYR
jgi:hypothetical protein